MFETILQNLMVQFPDWINAIFSLAVLRQVIALLGILLAAWLLQLLLRRLLYALATRFGQTSWSRKFFTVIGQALFPFVALVLSQPALALFRASGWDHTFWLAWVIPFMGLWLLYRILSSLLRLNLPSTQAELWSRKVLLPFFILVGTLNGLGFLDDLLQFSLTPSGTQPIMVRSIITGLVTLAIFFVLAQGIRRFLGQVFLPQAGVEPALANALASLVTYTVVIIGAMIALSAVGLDLTTLAVILGGLSVGLGFGLQAIVNNFVSGFILMFERAIGPGDVIQVGDTQGVVQSIGIRSILVKSPDNIEFIIPNSHFLSEMTINLTRSDPTVRVRLSVGVSYTATPREVEQALLEAAQHPYILAEPAPTVQFRDLANGTLNFDLLVWTNEPTRIPALSSDLRFGLWDALAKYHIELVRPQQEIHVHLNESKADTLNQELRGT